MPDLISILENKLFAAGVLRLIGLSLLQVLYDSLVSLLQASCESVCLDFPIHARRLLRALTLHHQMVVVLCPGWDHPCGRVYCVIGIEFS